MFRVNGKSRTVPTDGQKPGVVVAEEYPAAKPSRAEAVLDEIESKGNVTTADLIFGGLASASDVLADRISTAKGNVVLRSFSNARQAFETQQRHNSRAGTNGEVVIADKRDKDAPGQNSGCPLNRQIAELQSQLDRLKMQQSST